MSFPSFIKINGENHIISEKPNSKNQSLLIANSFKHKHSKPNVNNNLSNKKSNLSLVKNDTNKNANLLNNNKNSSEFQEIYTNKRFSLENFDFHKKPFDTVDKTFTKKLIKYVQFHVKKNLNNFLKYDDEETTKSCRDADENLEKSEKHLSLDSYESSSNSDFDVGSMETDACSSFVDQNSSETSKIFIQNNNKFIRNNSLTSLENIVTKKSNLLNLGNIKSELNILVEKNNFDGIKRNSLLDFTKRAKVKYSRKMTNEVCIICNHAQKQNLYLSSFFKCCKHKFHEKCFDFWLEQFLSDENICVKLSCPNCQKKVLN